ncbi:MAG: rod shape-determining protein MreC [Altererythrobacter ishigakiensis]|nr:rod shape-determining protein MreC [Altererythrobacter ishigakiensis]
MAPPSSRRSGHSRKAQYSRFTAYVIASVGAAIGAVFLGISLLQPSSFGSLRGMAGNAGEPGGRVVSASRDGSATVFDHIAAYWNAGNQNVELRDELEISRIRMEELEAVKQENARLKALLNLAEDDGEPVTLTRIIGSSAVSARRFGYIGAGTADGVQVGMPVRSERGILGRVLETASSTSRVLLLTDSESVIPVRRAQDDLIAFAEGRGDGLIRIRLINLGINPIEVGDVFVTSGAGGYFKPGLAVAVVHEITGDGGLARMIADPAGADFVRVEKFSEAETIVAAQESPDRVLGETGAGE